MKNLIIGNTSQLSYYFPDDYEKISSRDINFEKFKDKTYDRTYICFADQRTFIQNNLDQFMLINYDYTIKVINFFKEISNKVVIYSTSELWNAINGKINLKTNFHYNYSPYIRSKHLLTKRILKLKDYYPNVIIIYPFNFNSPHRKGGFLFGKIFDSLINDKKIEIGDINFNRDLIHPSYIIERSIKAESDEIVGSGNLINVNKFVKDLYTNMNMDYEHFVKINENNNLKIKRNDYYLDSNNKYPYKMLLDKTLEDIKKFKNK